MIKAGRSELAFRKEQDGLLNFITTIRSVIGSQKKLYLCDPTIITKRRKFCTPSGPCLSSSRPRDSASFPRKTPKRCTLVPEGIAFCNLEEVFEPLRKELMLCCQSSEAVRTTPKHSQNAALKNVGAKVRIFWTKNEIGSTGWRQGKIIGFLWVFYYLEKRKERKVGCKNM